MQVCVSPGDRDTRHTLRSVGYLGSFLENFLCIFLRRFAAPEYFSNRFKVHYEATGSGKEHLVVSRRVVRHLLDLTLACFDSIATSFNSQRKVQYDKVNSSVTL